MAAKVLALVLCLAMRLSALRKAFQPRHSSTILQRQAIVLKKSALQMSTQEFGNNGTSNNLNLNTDSLTTLLKEVGDILLTPGLPRAGITRSIQIGRATRNIILDFSKSRESFMDQSTGSISVPKVLRKVFEEFGATYIKLGQFIASSPTLFPAEYVDEFQACLDNSPTFPYRDIKKIIQADLQRPLSSVFASIDPVPLASASIAQVHRATLRDGTSVVIKVRKPGVDGTLKADLSFLYIASKLIEFINPSISSFSLSNIVEDIRESMLDELDFRKEIKNIENFRTFLSENNLTADATAPTPYPEYSGKRVLTMEYLDGVPLVDLESIQKFTKTPEATLVSALRTWALSVATNDKFHADVHAGNLLVLADGRVGFIDFGIVGKISNTFRSAILSVVDSFVEEDFEGVAKALVSMGATSTTVDTKKFGVELEEVIKQIESLTPELMIETTSSEVGGIASVEAQLVVDQQETTRIVLDIVNVAEKNGLKLPREFGLILKQALYFDRYQKILAPSMDLRDARVRDGFGNNIVSSSEFKKNMGVIDVEGVVIE